MSAKANGIKLALVSSAATWMVEKALDKLQLKNTFGLVITQEHVTRHKPDPEAYLLALGRLDIAAHEVMVFEDSTAGLKAAAEADCKSIAIAHRFNVNHDTSLAQFVIADFAGLMVDGKLNLAPRPN